MMKLASPAPRCRRRCGQALVIVDHLVDSKPRGQASQVRQQVGPLNHQHDVLALRSLQIPKDRPRAVPELLLEKMLLLQSRCVGFPEFWLSKELVSA